MKSKSEKKTAAVAADPVTVINHLLVDALRRGATDIHLELSDEGARVRLRIDGNLTTEPALSKGDLLDGVVSRIMLMADLPAQHAGKALEGRFRIKTQEKDVDVRLSVMPTIRGESIAMRLLPRNLASTIPPVDKLGLTPLCQQRLQWLIDQPSGLVLVSGPTGSGKTTTLYSIYQKLNKPEVKIVTIEDPVGYTLPDANQVQVNAATGMTFAAAMRCQQQQDPDILLVGEIRDRETALLSIESALTGHLVLSAMHSNCAVDTVRRLIDKSGEPYLVSSALAGVVAQRLVRKVCQHCKEPAAVPGSLVKALGARATQTFYRGKGCDRCHQGYKGRLAILEVLVMDDRLRKFVADDATADAIRAQALASGMVPMRDEGIARAAEGLTTLDEVWRVCHGD